MTTSDRKPWRASEVNLVKGTLKQRQAEDQRRADAWLKTREAELEAVLGRMYDGTDVPGVPELLAKLQEVMKPYIAEFDRLFTAAYPAEFAKARLGLSLTPGGIIPKLRDKVRIAATRHLLARYRNMLANIAGHAPKPSPISPCARPTIQRSTKSWLSWLNPIARRRAWSRPDRQLVGETAAASRGMGL